MEITELDGLFMTPARRKALAGVLALAERGRVELRGLAGSAPAMVFAALEGLKAPLLVVGDSLTMQAICIKTLRSFLVTMPCRCSLQATSVT